MELQCYYQNPVDLLRQRVLAMESESLNTGWEDVLIPQGAALCAETFGDTDLLNWTKQWVDYHLETGIRTEVTGYFKQGIVIGNYCGNWGIPLVLGPLYRLTKEERYRDFAIQVAERFLAKAVRLQDGVIAHGGEGMGRHTVWVDTLYYTASVLGEIYSLSGREEFAREAVKQCLLHSRLLRDPFTGVFFHDADPVTLNRSVAFWSRGNGWVILALADTLRTCPRETEGWDEVMAIYRALAAGLLRYRHPSGLWRIVPDDCESHLEISGSTMIVSGLAIGVREGWLEQTLDRPLFKSFVEIQSWIDRHGALQGNQRPAGLGGWEQHRFSQLGECSYSTGLFLRLLAEFRRSNLV